MVGLASGGRLRGQGDQPAEVTLYPLGLTTHQLGDVTSLRD
ncbi:hypothetical protein K701_09655 [Streptomyces fradiae ATCC 10745 = DSM 40063]|uniref:Uncharacterized protein n=1 Tax=Streptomyces fradiae ATCC 10745 = DSM 40063 TaxID=1319510 RepID=A0ABQ6XPT6_STRFR|nr:hypothetical protein K701_22065 [Streptomyces fradiae ATCC 10745 = DSM 40063]KAF0650044.1 hypothetical protein K701_09655 [Streptomyces fradiae ATCC 10745 = DSM 40063]